MLRRCDPDKRSKFSNISNSVRPKRPSKCCTVTNPNSLWKDGIHDASFQLKKFTGHHMAHAENFPTQVVLSSRGSALKLAGPKWVSHKNQGTRLSTTHRLSLGTSPCACSGGISKSGSGLSTGSSAEFHKTPVTIIIYYYE